MVNEHDWNVLELSENGFEAWQIFDFQMVSLLTANFAERIKHLFLNI